MIKLTNGHELEFLASSGALAYDGKGWPWEWPLRWVGVLKLEQFTIVTKTLTLEPRKGNLRWYKPFAVLRPLGNGNWVNAIGLTNPGLNWWIDRCYPKIKSGLKIIVSVFPQDVKECQIMCLMLNKLNDIVGIEINASCPNVNVKQDIVQICKTARYAMCHPLILKISYYHSVEIVQEASEYLEAVHAINSGPWNLVFPNKKSPLAKYGGGGVSGPIIAPFARAKIRELAEKTDLPIVAGGGICSLKDIQIFKELGGSAFSIGSLFFRPWEPNRLVKKLQAP